MEPREGLAIKVGAGPRCGPGAARLCLPAVCRLRVQGGRPSGRRGRAADAEGLQLCTGHFTLGHRDTGSAAKAPAQGLGASLSKRVFRGRKRWEVLGTDFRIWLSPSVYCDVGQAMTFLERHL